MMFLSFYGLVSLNQQCCASSADRDRVALGSALWFFHAAVAVGSLMDAAKPESVHHIGRSNVFYCSSWDIV